MNWLMYIAGGWLWIMIVFILPASFLDTVVNKDTSYGILKLIWSFSAVSVWIWICWRFIK